jgi:hypothetical protein
MITPKIKALFQFIEYLHSNIDNFKQYDEIINKLHLLDKERQKVRSKKTFKDKLKYDEVQEQIKDKFKVIQENILTPIQAKANELKICDLNKTETLWNWNTSEIHELKENFSKDDLPKIFSHKNKYLEYRTATKGEAFFGLGFFFGDLDEVLKTLFDFFKETEQNEFEAFETKAIHVNDISEAVKLLQQGKFQKFTLPNSFLNPSTIQQQPNTEPLPPQPIVKQKPEQETPKTFDELFYNADLVKPCIDILKELDPPLIDTDCNYIGKLKGVFCVWIDEMQRQGIVKHYSDRKIFASLIPQKIKRFSIDESMFGKHQNKAENLYRTDIKTKVSKIKLSQNSQ